MTSPRSRRVDRDAPAAVLRRVRSVCLRLPNTREEAAWVGTRWVVRRKTFAHLLVVDGGWPPAYAKLLGADGTHVVLTLRVDRDAGEALRRAADADLVWAPWSTNWGTSVVCMLLSRTTDWSQVRSLLTESHRLLAG